MSHYLLLNQVMPDLTLTAVQYAYVTTNLLDLRGEPTNDSERLSQLFFADIVETSEERAGFVAIRQADGYNGWVDLRFLAPISRDEALEYRRKANAVIVTPQASVLDPRTRESIPPHFLYYGTLVRLHTGKGSAGIISTPDHKRLAVRAASVKSTLPNRVKTPSGAALIREAKRFLGVPYLWGGISASGYDCSGLTRTICARFGLYLPRDTKDQIGVGRHIERSDVKTGDLLFFKRHVGFAIGKDGIIHASRGGGGVRINSLVAGTEDYRPDLDQDFQEARRILE
jgi:gamma-D-glutamyl-L-lysine dipeptidyl-peptidase